MVRGDLWSGRTAGTVASAKAAARWNRAIRSSDIAPPLRNGSLLDSGTSIHHESQALTTGASACRPPRLPILAIVVALLQDAHVCQVAQSVDERHPHWMRSPEQALCLPQGVSGAMAPSALPRKNIATSGSSQSASLSFNGRRISSATVLMRVSRNRQAGHRSILPEWLRLLYWWKGVIPTLRYSCPDPGCVFKVYLALVRSRELDDQLDVVLVSDLYFVDECMEPRRSAASGR
jgi:hypothetical protein